MAQDSFIDQYFPVRCKGRDREGKEVLDDPIRADVQIYQRNGDEQGISSYVSCKYNCGSHGEKCGSAGIDNQGYCPFSFDLPHALERKNEE